MKFEVETAANVACYFYPVAAFDLPNKLVPQIVSKC